MILRCEADESDSKATEKVIDGYVLGAGSTGVDGLLTEKRVLEAQIVHQSAADGPGIGKGDLAIVYGFRLIENGLSGINRQYEVLLVNEESRAELMASHGVVRVHNRVMFALENRNENGDISAVDISGNRAINAARMNRYRPGTVRWGDWKISQQGCYRAIRSIRL